MKVSGQEDNWRLAHERDARARYGFRAGVLLALVLASLLYTGSTGGATAQADDLQAQSEASYTFGQHMRFSLRAKSEVEITGATLFFNTPQMESTFTYDFDVEPAKEIALEHDVALMQVQLAPFTTVRYWWRLTTERGSSMIQEQTFSYVDDRFQWQEMAREGIVIRWTGDEQALGQVALDVIARARPHLEATLPVDIGPVEVYIYPSMADLRSALRLTGRDWIGAEAMPELGVILVSAVNPRTASLDLGQSIPHELSHLMLYRVMGNRYEAAPRWLDEGLATGFETTGDVNHQALLDEAVAAQQTIQLQELCASFPNSEAQTQLAYAQSAAIVEYIRREYGTGALQDLVQAYIDGADCESGLRRVLGLSLHELEQEWLAQARPASPLARFLRVNGLWMLLAGGGFLVMALLVFPLKRER